VCEAEAKAETIVSPLTPERTEGSPLGLSTYAFSWEKVVTFDGTFFPNLSNEADVHSVCEPNPGVFRVAGGFTPLSIGEVRPSDVPWRASIVPGNFAMGF
jgi:hypothetical protein